MIESLQSLDREFFLFLNSLHAEWLNSFMVIVSGQIIWAPFLLFFIWYAYKAFGRLMGIFVLFMVLTLITSDVTSSYVLKNLTSRLRPCRDLELGSLIYSFGQKCGGKYGFVSSHAANSLAFVVFSIRCLFPHQKLSWLFLLIPIMIGYSRIYLGVHYPGDILGGFMVGLFWSLVFSTIFKLYYGARREISQES